MSGVDRLLCALRATGPDSYRCTPRPDAWIARCPACREPDALDIREAGSRAVFACAFGCERAAILEALATAEDNFGAERTDWAILVRSTVRVADRELARIALRRRRGRGA